jgi:hypothetical protein
MVRPCTGGILASMGKASIDEVFTPEPSGTQETAVLVVQERLMLNAKSALIGTCGFGDPIRRVGWCRAVSPGATLRYLQCRLMPPDVAVCRRSPGHIKQSVILISPGCHFGEQVIPPRWAASWERQRVVDWALKPAVLEMAELCSALFHCLSQFDGFGVFPAMRSMSARRRETFPWIVRRQWTA